MFYVGIDIGGMSIKGGIVNSFGEIIKKDSFKTEIETPAQIIIKNLAEFILNLIKDANLSLNDIDGIGLGVPGTIHENIVRFSNNLKWEMVPIVDLLLKHINYNKNKIFAENDANCAILGEVYCGLCKGVKHAIMITLGTGVGTGILSHGVLITGNDSCGSEGGHMVIHPKGLPCTCGRKGCFEAYASATALIKATEKVALKDPNGEIAKITKEVGRVSGKTPFEAERRGDKAGKKIVNDYIKDIALGITNLSNIFRPEVVVIGGGVSNEGEWLMNKIQKLVDKEVFGGIKINPKVKVLRASLLNDAGIIGAASLAIHKLNG